MILNFVFIWLCGNIFRIGKLLLPKPGKDYNDTEQRLMYRELYFEAIYYGLDTLCAILNPGNYGYYSSILNHKTFKLLQSWINKTGNVKQEWELLYRASNDGFTSNTFHAKCDGIDNTLLVIKANNKIFGGYTPLQWCNIYKDTIILNKQKKASNDEIKFKCLNTFLYLINNNNDIYWKKHYKPNPYANNDFISIPIGYTKHCGPVFGRYKALKAKQIPDVNIHGIKPVNTNNNSKNGSNVITEGLIISNKCNENNQSSWTHCGFFDTPIKSQDLAGSKHFFVDDIEVYHVKLTLFE